MGFREVMLRRAPRAPPRPDCPGGGPHDPGLRTVDVHPYSVIDLQPYITTDVQKNNAIDVHSLSYPTPDPAMTSPNQKLAASLAVLAEVQRDDRRVFESSEMSRLHRDRLRKAGFIEPVVNGWWMSADPGAPPGDTTAWYASFWEFCIRYCTSRFGNAWHLSPELSLRRHGDAMDIPRQVVVYAPEGTNNTLELPFGTSLFDYAERTPPKHGALTAHHDLRLFTIPAALTRVPPEFFRRHPLDAQVALISLSDVSDLLRLLLEGSHTVVAGRLVGALRRVGRSEEANEILGTMERARHDVRETDPFDGDAAPITLDHSTPPIVTRLTALWESMRGEVLERCAFDPQARASSAEYMERITSAYAQDAYHSLSIEGYRVSPELIERVRTGEWNPEANAADRAGRDAMAARGYWLAFQDVSAAIEGILRDAGPGAPRVARDRHREWYRLLFQPAVTAGLIEPARLAGYRSSPIYIQGSRHVPPRVEAMRDAMTALFDLLEKEESPVVRGVLGHWMIGYIHPFPDGNGRIARFLMNVMLASGGLPWTVIRVDDREEYMAALEAASVDGDIRPFAEFIGGGVRGAMEGATP